MTSLATALVGMLVFFVGFLLLRSFFSWSVCALCAGVAATWVLLLILLQLGFTVDPLVVGLLMGGSSVGIMYFLVERLEEKYHIFRPAFLATLIVVAYLLIAGQVATDAAVVLLLLWIGSVGLFLKRDEQSLKTVVKKIIHCCKNW